MLTQQGRRKKHEIEPPLQIRDLLAKATAAYGSGDLELAGTICQEIINIDDTFGVAYNLLSQIHEDKGEKKEAIDALVKACSHYKRDPVLWLRTARLNRELGYYKEALKCYDTYFLLCDV
jgi:tetratricopeptide (TPR) repeat protein